MKNAQFKIVFSSILIILGISLPGWAQKPRGIPTPTSTPTPSSSPSPTPTPYVVDHAETERTIIRLILSRGPSEISRVDNIHGTNVIIHVGKTVLDTKGNFGKIKRLLVGEYVEVEFTMPQPRIEQLDVSHLIHLTHSYKTKKGIVFKRDDVVRTKEGALGTITMLFTNGLAQVDFADGSYIIENIANGYTKEPTVEATAKVLPPLNPARIIKRAN